MRAPDLTREEVKTTTYSIKREDSNNKVLSLKSECSSDGFAGAILKCVKLLQFQYSQGTQPIQLGEEDMGIV